MILLCLVFLLSHHDHTNIFHRVSQSKVNFLIIFKTANYIALAQNRESIKLGNRLPVSLKKATKYLREELKPSTLYRVEAKTFVATVKEL